MGYLDTMNYKGTEYELKDSKAKRTQSPVTSPTASGTATAFVSDITQNEEGVITPTKANVPTASTSIAGLVQLNDTLTSTSTDQALTAAKGKALNDNIEKVQNGLAYIVGDTNTTGSTLAVGAFVYVKDHASITEGLRKVTASISANGSITTNNTEACPEGGLNALNSKIDYGTILNLQQITDAYVTRSTYQSRKFSDYKMLIFTIVVNNWAKISSVISPSVFSSLSGVDIRYQDTNGLVEVDIKYTSDTSFDAKYIGTPSAGVFIYCYGILKN